jgi:hypothetical protein
MKKFMNLKVKTWELVVICIILASVVLRPNWLIQLNQTLIGKVLLLVVLVAAALHKPYMGLLVLLLIVSLGFYREGLEDACSKHTKESLCTTPCEWLNSTCGTPDSDERSDHSNTEPSSLISNLGIPTPNKK